MKSNLLLHSLKRTNIPTTRCYSSLESPSPYNHLDEYRILQSLLLPPRVQRGKKLINDTSKGYTLPFIKQIKNLRLLEESRKGQQQYQHQLHAINPLHSKFSHSPLKELPPEVVGKISNLINSRYLSKLDIDHFFKIHVLSDGGNSVHAQKYLFEKCLAYMIEESNQKSLKPVMEYVEMIWKDDRDVTQMMARSHLSLILKRSIAIFDPSEYFIENSEIIAKMGIEDIRDFKVLYDLYLKLFKVTSSDSTLNDLYFQLLSKCGTIELADEFLNANYLRNSSDNTHLPTNESIDLFIKSLSKHALLQREVWEGNEREFNDKIKTDLIAYKELLVNDRISPAVIEFLLLWTNNIDEVYSVLELAKRSKYADKIYSECQVDIVEAVVKGVLSEGVTKMGDSESNSTNLTIPSLLIPIHIKAMAHMFGTLNRFTKTSTGITPSVLDKCLLLSAKYGNSAGMYKALAMRLDLEPAEISASTLSQVFDCFPIANGIMNEEKRSSPSLWVIQDAIISDPERDQAILYHLRTMIKEDKGLFQKYISALGRCGRTDRLDHEWNEFKLNNNWSSSPEIILEFISAFKTAKSIDQGLAVIEHVLANSDKNEKYYTTSVHILKDIFRYEILPLNQTLRFVADWFMSKKHTTKWLVQDIETIFDEVKGTNSITSLTIGEANIASTIGKEVASTIIQVRGGLDVERSINLLNELLGKEIRI